MVVTTVMAVMATMLLSVGVMPATAAPPSGPDAPTNLQASPRDGGAAITFTPGADNGSAITNFQYNLNGGEWQAFSPEQTISPVSITGLQNYTSYEVRLRAVSDAGDGTESDPVSVTPSPSRVFAWGNDRNGEFGDGTSGGIATIPALGATALATAGESIVDIDAAGNMACAVTTSGDVYCWGSGRLGDGQDLRTSEVPVQAGTSGPMADKVIVDVAVGVSISCALSSEGEVFCWGFGLYGGLGNGTNDTALSPVAVDTSGVLAGKRLTEITNGGNHMCALASDGLAFCWGPNFEGQLGAGPGFVGSQNSPVAVLTTGALAGKTLAGIDAGLSTTCAYDTAGQGYCWGDNRYGQLGNGPDGPEIVQTDQPTAVYSSGVLSGARVVDLGVGKDHACAVLANGTAACWGSNDQGQLGTDAASSWEPNYEPVAVDTSGVLSGKTLTSIAAGFYHTCANATVGGPFCWGSGGEGVLGNGSQTGSFVPVAVDTSGVMANSQVQQVVASEYNTFAWGTIPATAPAAPENLAVAPNGNPGELEATFTAGDDGGAPITDYEYRVGLGTPGQADTAFNTNVGTTLNGQVYTVALQPDGKVVVGGGFTSVSNRLARFNADGTPDTAFNDNVGLVLNDNVLSVAVQPDGKILAGGWFYMDEENGGAPASRLMRFNADGTPDTAFNTNVGDVIDNRVYTVALDANGKIVVGGQFTAPGQRLVRYNADGTLDTAFNGQVGTTINGAVRSLEIEPDGQILAGGEFAAPSNYLARFNANGSADTAFNTAIGSVLNGDVYSIDLTDEGQIVIGGGFTSVSNYVARFSSAGAADTAFNTAVGTTLNNIVFSVALQDDGKVLAGGFSTAPSKYLSRFNADGTSDTAFNTAIGSTTLSDLSFSIQVQPSGMILLGGFSRTPSRYLARFFPGSGPWTSAATTTSPLTITGLANSTTYDVELRAVNAAGAGAVAGPESGTTAGVPAAPTELAATPGAGSVSIAFTPGDDGGAAISNYEYQLDGGAWTAFAPEVTTSPVEISGLTNGTEYSIKLRAVNGVGAGAASEAVSATPVSTADAPTGLVAVGGTDSATVSFTPGATGGSPITNYEYQIDGGDWTAFDPEQTTSPVTIDELAPGAQYSIALRAVTDIGTGAASAPAVATVGVSRAAAWGSNALGQLGAGTSGPANLSSVPLAVESRGALAGKTISSVGAGDQHACAVTTDGGVYCWGANISGQLGDGTTDNRDVPVAVDTSGVLDGQTVVEVAAGGSFTCARTSDGAVYCWGGNEFGQLGNDSTTASYVPVAVNTAGVLAGKTVVSITAGLYQTCAATSDGGAYCWGYNFFGQLGNGASGPGNYQKVPVAVSTAGVLAGKIVTSVGAGQSHTCAVTLDGGAFCWGMGTNGQLGNDGTSNSSVPVAVNTAGVLAGKSTIGITGGDLHSCAWTSDGLGVCWGANFSGQLGTGDTTQSRVPVAVSTAGALSGKSVVDMSAGGYFTCAVTADGQSLCWGQNADGNLGDGTTTARNSPTPVVATGVLSDGPVTEVSAGQYFAVVAYTGTGAQTPAAPTGLSVTPGARSAEISFTPGYDGGEPITDYEYRVRVTGAVEWGAWTSAGVATSPVTVTGLADATTYDIQIRAVNVIGTGVVSDTMEATTPGVPAAPVDLAVASNGESGELEATFTPGSDGGSPITDYEYRLGSGTAPGTPDTAFNTEIGAQLDGAVNAMVVQADGKIVVAGAFTTPSSYLARFNADGTPDMDFNDAVGTNLDAAAMSLGLQPDGKILVGGDFTSPSTNLARFNADGSADTTFNSALSEFNSTVEAIAVQTDGKIVVGGDFYSDDVRYIARVNADGSEDYAFNMRAESYIERRVTALAIQSDGGILVGSETDYMIGPLARLQADGDVDFGFSMAVASDFDAPVDAIVVQPDGNILVGGGFTSSSNYVARVAANGTLDNLFGTNVGNAFDARVRSLALQSDGGIIVGGDFTTPSRGMARLTSTGALDSAYNTTVGTSLDGNVFSVAAPSDGSVLAAGSFTAPSTSLAGFGSGYDVWISGGVAASPVTITGLTNGTSYDVQVRAVNAVGAGAAAGPESGTPEAVPAAPTALQATPRDGGAAINFTPGSDNGSAITNYEYSLDGGQWEAFDPAQTASPVSITGLDNYTAYEVRLRAVNAFGDGAESAAVSVTPSPGRLFAWGNNAQGQFGNGTTGGVSTVPVLGATALAEAGESIVDIDSGGSMNCAVTQSGDVYCWGLGYLGDGQGQRNSDVPVQVGTSGPMASEDIVDVAVGLFSACALSSEGDVFCWGDGMFGTLGDGTNDTALDPVAVDASGVLAGKTLTEITSGAFHVCVLAADGEAFCWGNNIFGQLGAGYTSGPQSTPMAVLTSGALAGKTLAGIDAGIFTTCAYDTAGAGYCWGGNGVGQLGNGTTTSAAEPTPIDTSGVLDGARIVDFGLGNGHSCAVLADGSAACWGENALGELGTGTTDPSLVPVAVVSDGALAGKTLTSISAGYNYTCATAEASGPFCWGVGSEGVLGDGAETTSQVPVAVDASGVMANSQVQQVVANDYQTIAWAPIPAVAPGPPTAVSWSPTNTSGEVTIEFSAPAESGGPEVTGYEYSVCGADIPACPWTPLTYTGSGPYTAEFSGLTDGQFYNYRLRAVNEVGASSPVFVYFTPGLPSVPLEVSAASGDSSAVISFTAPEFNGGSPVTNYSYRVRPDGGEWGAWVVPAPPWTFSPIPVTGLVNGTTYDLEVRAINSVGSGATADAGTVTPSGVPDAPSAVVGALTATEGQVSVTWDPPTESGGFPIASYEVTATSSDPEAEPGTCTVSGSPAATTCDISGLSLGATYEFTVVATNSVGTAGETSAPSAPLLIVGPASAPQDLAAQPTDVTGEVEVTFNAPADSGSGTVSGYEYRVDGGAWVPVAGSPVTITGLTDGTAYDVEVRAVNQFPGGGAVAGPVSVTPRSAPGAPTIDTINSGDGQLEVEFTAPANTGGSAITDYEYTIDANAEEPTWVSAGAAGSPVTITGLSNGTTYNVALRAVNAAGIGPASAAVDATPYTVPGAPTITSVAAGDQRIVVSFTPPSATGGSTITGYEVVAADSQGTLTSVSGAGSPLTLLGLINGETYSVAVRAQNAAGWGVASPTSSGVVPFGKPQVPAGVTGTPGPGIGEITISWTPLVNAPSVDPNNNGREIIHYAGMALVGSTPIGQCRGFGQATDSCVISGLTPGTSYTMAVRAMSSAGWGRSGIGGTTVTPAQAAGAPTITGITAGNEQLEVAFTPPVSDGGVSITNYEYSVDASAGTPTWVAFSPAVTTSPVTIASLTNGTTYSVVLRAVTSAGPGAASTASSGTPVTTAGAPTVTSATPGDQQIQVAFTAPTDTGGSTITYYQYSTDGGTSWADVGTTSSPFTITEPSSAPMDPLVNGTTYNVLIRAVNDVGPGASSGATAVVPFGKPQQPTGISATPGPGGGQVRITWTALVNAPSPSANNNGRVVTQYAAMVVQGSTAIGQCRGTAQTDTSCVISGLTPGETYTTAVRALNAAGWGRSGTGGSVTVPGVPGAPTITGSNGGDSAFVVSFTAAAPNGGTVSNYQYSTDNGTTWRSFSPPLSGAGPFNAVVTRTSTGAALVNGTTYEVAVRGVSIYGSGAASTAVSVSLPAVPGAPTITSAEPTDVSGEIEINFEAPSDLGVPALTNYEYSTDGGSSWTTRSPVSTLSPIVIGGLEDGTVYTVAIRGVNTKGPGGASNTEEVTPRTVPGAPTGLTVTPGNVSAGLEFTAPEDDGGDPISGYEYTTDDGETWLALTTSGTGPFTAEITTDSAGAALVNGDEYTVTVRAVNGAGGGAASDPETFTPRTVPGAPTGLTVTPGNVSAELEFTAPEDDGGDPISGYEYSTNGTDWVALTTTGTETLTATMTGTSADPSVAFVNGTEYTVAVRAVNLAGGGAASDPETFTPLTIPSAPQSLVATPGDVSAELEFGAPLSDGGSEITGYEYSTNGTDWLALTTSGTGPFTAEITTDSAGVPLLNGTAYPVAVRAVNAAGEGPSADTTVTPRTVPGAPTGLTVTPGNVSAELEFTAPGDDGGDPISGYEYSTNGTDWVALTTTGTETLTATITGTSTDPSVAFVNGDEYTVAVRAVNLAGGGAASDPESFTPRTTPGAPTGLTVTPGDVSAELEFTAPEDDGGDPVSGYEYSTNGTDWAALTTTGTETLTATITGTSTDPSVAFVNGTEYTAAVRAVNGAGGGAASDPESFTPVAIPDAPTALTATPGNQQITLEFSAPAEDGGSPITAYEYSTNGTDWSVLTTTGTGPFSATISGTSTDPSVAFVNGDEYTVAVRAVNAVGDGPATDPVTATPRTTPGAPTALAAAPNNTSGEVAVTFTAPAEDGGADITDYEYRLDGAGDWLSSGDAGSPVTITGLINGIEYSIELRAVNAAGAGPEAGPVTATPRGVPGAPTIDSVTEDDSALTVAFTAPGDDGGADITNYEYTLDGGSNWITLDPEQTSGPIEITGLTNGTPYDVGVRAINAAGEGATSNIVEATPRTIPGAPTNLVATPGNASALLAFRPPADTGGATITGYEYTTDGGATWKALTTSGTTTLTATITTTSNDEALLNGTEYTVAVRASNEAGEGAASESATVTPATVPDAPTVSSASAGNAAINMTFSEPVDNGGATVASYQYTTDGGTSWASLPVTGSSPYTVAITEASARGQANIQFATPVNYAADGNVGYVEFADLNNDGKQDMLAGSNGQKLGIRLGNGDGTFGNRTDYTAGSSPVWIDTGDINGDGKIDVTMTSRFSSLVQVWLGNGDGTLQTPATSFTSNEAYGVAFADFNGDGDLDLVYTNRSGKKIEVRFGDGAGAFGDATQYGTGDFPRGLVTGDLNNDGYPDVIIANSSSNNVGYFMNNGDGTFATMVVLAAGTQTVAPAVADFNNDGKLDIAVTVAREGPDNVSVWLGNGNGTFGSRARYNVSQNPIGLAAGDLTGDGVIDLVTGSYWDGVVSVLEGKGDGTFYAQRTFSGVSTPYGEALADLNGDGKLDLGVANLGRADVSIFMNGTAPAVVPIANGSTYSVGVRALNSQGAGAASAYSSVTPATVPIAPTITSVVPGAESLTVTVGALTTPEQNGGSAILTYRVIAYDYEGIPAGLCIATAPATSCTVTGLPATESYTLRARAQNSIGFGPLSTATSPYTPLPPP